MYPIIVPLHIQDDCQPAILHEVAVNADGNAVCVGVTAGEQCNLLSFNTCCHNVPIPAQAL